MVIRKSTKLIVSLFFISFLSQTIYCQVFINRESPITSAEVFGITKPISFLGSKFGGMYTETTGATDGRPFYGYAINGSVKSYSYFNGGDNGLHFYHTGDKMSIWQDSMQWKIDADKRLFYNGYKLEFGEDGNTFLGKGVTPSTSANNIGNTVLGWLSGRSMSSGVSNTIVGFRNAEELTTGDFNTVVGSQAANKLAGGSRNTYIGYRSGWNAGAGNTGNVFLGYRVGEGLTVNDKLMIGNSESSTPLIEGSFVNPEMKVNGDARITGGTEIDGLTVINDNTNIFGTLGVVGTTNTSYANLTGSNPYIDFKPGGSSGYFIQYDQSDDELNIHRTGLGDILKVKSDGTVYLPELATIENSRIEIKPDGELVLNTYPIVYEYTILEEINYPFGGSCNCNIIPAKDLRNGDVLSQMTIRSIWNSALNNPTSILLARRNKFDGTQEFLYGIGSLGAGSYNQEFNVNLNNHVVDTNNWTYYMYITESSSYTYIRLRRNP